MHFTSLVNQTAFGAGAYTASDKALRGKSGLVQKTSILDLIWTKYAAYSYRISKIPDAISHSDVLVGNVQALNRAGGRQN